MAQAEPDPTTLTMATALETADELNDLGHQLAMIDSAISGMRGEVAEDAVITGIRDTILAVREKLSEISERVHPTEGATAAYG